MKKILYIVFALLVMGCSNVEEKKTGVNLGFAPVKEFTYDGCQYLYSRDGYSATLAHKGNCKNPIHKCK